jgi:hypothetical protein
VGGNVPGVAPLHSLYSGLVKLGSRTILGLCTGYVAVHQSGHSQTCLASHRFNIEYYSTEISIHIIVHVYPDSFPSIGKNSKTQFNAESKIFRFVLNPIILTPHLYSRDPKP